MKKSKFIYVLGVAALLSVGVTSLVGCGKTETVVLGGIEAPYFDTYVSKKIGGKDTMVTTSGAALIESGSTDVKVHAFEAPSGAEISFEVTDAQGKATDDLNIKADGLITVPIVTGTGVAARKVYTISCIAKVAKEGEETKEIKKSTTLTVVPAGSIATGEQDLTALTTVGASQIFGQAEQLAMETGLTGMNFWAYGGYTKISKRVYNSRSENGKFSPSTYVPGFGFGYDSYCYLSEDNPKESNAAYKRYFHTRNSNQPSNVNYFKSTGSDVTDYYNYCQASYFGKLLNDSDSDVYVPSLSSDAEPIPCDDDGNELTGDAAEGFHKKWKVHFNTGTTTDKVYYRNGGTKNGKAFDKVAIQLKDYLTPYILQYTQRTGAANVTQLLNGNSALEGASEYYAATAKKPANAVVDVDAFLTAVPGLKLNEKDSSITFTLTKGCTSDYAAYRLNNQGVMPLEFVQTTLGKGDLAAGLTKLGTTDTTDSSTPADNILSTGNYYLESMSEDKIVYKRNADWYVKKDPAGRDVYKMEGRVFEKDTSLQTDSTNTLLFAAYNNGYIESSSIPSAELAAEKVKPDTVQIANTGEKNGVSFNSLSKMDYQALFGDGTNAGTAIAGQFFGDFTAGSASNATYRKTYMDTDWAVKPIMSNHNFIKGLNCGYDRDTFAATKGRTGFADYFGDINKMSPKADKRWNDTDEHIAAVKAVYGDDGIPTNSNAKGVSYFKTALQEELEAGHYQLGTAASPTVISINVNWQSQVWVDYQGTAIFDAIAATFNSAVKSNKNWCAEDGSPLIKLEFAQTYEGSGSSDYTNAYGKVALGQYDIAQASISGGEYEVFQEMGLWEAINRSYSLTIHHALQTYIPSSSIYYEGKYWSIDGLFYANQEGVTLTSDGWIDYSKLNPIE